MNRRRFLRSLGLAATTPASAILAACSSAPRRGAAHVVVVGGGYGGATTAKYLRMWSAGRIDVTLVEREARFVSCPMSNLVLAGLRTLDDLTASYDRLRTRWGVRVINDEVAHIDVARRKLRLARNDGIGFDRVVLAPGVDFLTEQVAGLAGNFERIPHAWKAGPQTELLRRRIEAMPEGGVFALHVPKSPYRCPPGPYERACLVAHYLRARKPRAKLLLLDANSEIQSKRALFAAAFAGPYKDIIEYRPDSTLLSVDAQTLSAELEFDRVRADVLNVIPPMRAGRLVDSLDVPLTNGRWADVDWRTMEVRDRPGVHLIGDAVLAAPGMPKSGHIANQQAKLAAAAIVELFDGRSPDPVPTLLNTCYSFVDDRNAIHVATVHRYDAAEGTVLPVAGAGGLSSTASEEEGHYAAAWARNIRADMLA
ncbi:sulfide dehydrogenase (flavocytochrome c), flavoprotein subunit [Aromatoleum tolulyticum]|uniref:Sulfide dehydrogenase (Flavocytochrome c), flavoprotein subunit n=1 Tax=Aromatoleum tolulyticum TaxID=34027 RepID=A0A1N6WWJ7_9RHOO|nr:NAD(P)/FAD-dependent oxidoreductase [Aromatoleum tolulyticum]SIQ94504.1 sulfide dehydrogenase (flavocytochrome c), flavoprotein subunit [Aromatoleum tolulyticum]